MTPDETFAELAARIASMDERSGELTTEEKWLHAELVELYARIVKLHNQGQRGADKLPDSAAPTTKCKSCGSSITAAAAAASIFRLSFLPLRGKKTDRSRTTELAERIGPLCQTCLDRCKDLAEGDV